MRDLKVGDIVTLKEGSFFYKKGNRFTGIVRSINKWEEYGELTTENHGEIEIEITSADNYSLGPGELENFVYLGWQYHLEILESD